MEDEAQELIDALIERCAGMGWRSAARVLVRVLESNGMASDAIDALEEYGDDAIQKEHRALLMARRTVISVRPVQKERS